MKKLFSFRYLTALCFLLFLALFFLLSLRPFARESYYALRAGGGTALAESRFNDFLPGKDALVTLNGGVQRLLGRREVNQRYRLDNGQMTYIIPELDMEPIAQNTVAFARALEERFDRLFHAPQALDAARQLMECLLPRRDQPFAVKADDYGAYMMLRQLRGRLDLALPEVRTLARRDREDDSLYCLTLYTYLICHHSLQETCARLFTHRNTVLYRVRRMREDFGIPIDDPDRHLSLLLSAALMLVELGQEDALMPTDGS